MRLVYPVVATPRGRRPTPWLATVAVALFLFAQLAAVAHAHAHMLTQRANACAQLGVDSGVCSLCLLAFHLPVNPAPVPAVAVPLAGVQAPPPAAAPGVRVLRRAVCPTRAPPAA